MGLDFPCCTLEKKIEKNVIPHLMCVSLVLNLAAGCRIALNSLQIKIHGIQKKMMMMVVVKAVHSGAHTDVATSVK